MPDHVLFAVDGHRRDRGGEPVRLGSVRRGQEEHALVDVPEPAALHQLPTAGENRYGEPVGHAFPERGQIRNDTVLGLGTAETEAKAGDHLVEDEYGAFARGEVADRVEEPTARRLVALELCRRS